MLAIMVDSWHITDPSRDLVDRRARLHYTLEKRNRHRKDPSLLQDKGNYDPDIYVYDLIARAI
jgi:hypothetical protein